MFQRLCLELVVDLCLELIVDTVQAAAFSFSSGGLGVNIFALPRGHAICGLNNTINKKRNYSKNLSFSVKFLELI